MQNSAELSEIIRACKTGNEDAFSKLVDIYSNRCYGYFLRLTGNRDISNDLLSELFVKLIRKIGSYRGGSFDSWLFKTASNIFYDYLRAKRRNERLLKAELHHARELAAEPKKTDNEALDKMQIQLGKLDSDTRELIVLRYYSQLSFKEIAALRAEPIGTVLSKVHRGLKKLKELMTNKDG